MDNLLDTTAEDHQKISSLHEALNNRNLAKELSEEQCNAFFDDLINFSFVDPSLLTHENLNPTLLRNATSKRVNAYCSRLVSLSTAKNEEAQNKLLSIIGNLSYALDEKTLKKVAYILPDHEDVKKALRIKERFQIACKLRSKDTANLSSPEFDEFFGKLLDHAKDNSSLIVSDNITSDLLRKVSTDNLEQFFDILITATNDQPCSQETTAKKKLSSCLRLHLLQRLNLSMIKTLDQEFPDNPVVKKSLLNRTRLEKGIASRQFAVNARDGTLIGTGVGAVAVGGITSATIFATHTVGALVAGAMGAAAAGIVAAGVGVTAGAVGGAVNIGAYITRGITNFSRGRKEITFRDKTFNINHPSELAKLCAEPDLHECLDFPQIIDNAIQFSNELYGIPRTRDSKPLATLCANPSLESMSVRTKDVIEQATNISLSYNGEWPIYSDVCPLEALSSNPNLFNLPEHDKVIKSVFDLATTKQEYIASRTRGYHLLPLKKLALNQNLRLVSSASSDKLGKLRTFCSSVNLIDEAGSFEDAFQSIEKEKRNREITKKINQVFKDLEKKADDIGRESTEVREILAEAKFYAKKAEDIRQQVIDNQFPSQEELDKANEKLKTLQENQQKQEEKLIKLDKKLQKELTDIKATINQNQKNIAEIAERQGCNESSIQKLDTFCQEMKTEMTSGFKNTTEELEKLSQYKEFLGMISSPKAIKAISDILEGRYAEKNHQDDMKALRDRLVEDPKLSDKPDSINEIIDFSKNYHEALMCVYRMSPVLASGALQTAVGRRTFIREISASLVKVITSGSNNPITQAIGAVYGDALNDSAEENSRKLMLGMESLGMINDSATKPDHRTDAQKERVASDIISTHTIEIALHLAENPEKIKKYKDKLKSYSQKTFDGIKGIDQDLRQINSGRGNFTFSHDKKTFDPKSEAAAYMTQAALAGMFTSDKTRVNLVKTTLNLHYQMRGIKPKIEIKQGWFATFKGTINPPKRHSIDRPRSPMQGASTSNQVGNNPTVFQ